MNLRQFVNRFSTTALALVALAIMLNALETQAQSGLALTTTWGGYWYDHGKLTVVEVSGLKRHTLSKTQNAYGPTFSRDGKKIAYIVGKGSAIRVCNVDGSGDKEIVKNIGYGGGSGSYLTWCSDGFIYWGAGKEVKKVNSAGGKVQVVAKQSHQLFGATFSADGKKGGCFTKTDKLNAMAFVVGGKAMWFKRGCQGTISPNGAYVTNNHTDHKTFTIRNFNGGGAAKTLKGVGKDNLNNHRFSHHTNDYMMYTRNESCNGCGKGVQGWLVNWRTNQRVKLGDNLVPYDYHPTAKWGKATDVVSKATSRIQKSPSASLANGHIRIGVKASNVRVFAASGQQVFSGNNVSANASVYKPNVPGIYLVDMVTSHGRVQEQVAVQ